MAWAPPEGDFAPQQETAWQPPEGDFAHSPEVAHGLIETLDAAYQSSGLGLAIRGKLPSVVENPDANIFERGAYDVANVVSDIPTSVAGAVAGAGIGGAAGSAVPVVGTAFGAGAGAVAGLGAAPMAVRMGLMKLYSNGGPKTWGDVLRAGWEGMKGAGEGGAVSLAAATGTELAAPALATMTGASPTLGFAAKRLFQAGTTAEGSAVLNGRLYPDQQDFEFGAIVGAGMSVAADVAPRLMNIYARTGLPPGTVADMMKRDPGLKDAITSSDDLPAQLKPMATQESVNSAVPDPAQGQQVPPASDPVMTPPVPINTDMLHADPDAIRGAVTKLSDLLQRSGRWSVSTAETLDKAQQMLTDRYGTGAMTPWHAPGASVNAPEMAAWVMLGQKSADTMVDRAQAILTNLKNRSPEADAAFLASMENDGAIMAQTIGEASEPARAMRAIQTFGDQTKRIRAINEAISTAGGSGDIESIARAVVEAQDEYAKSKAAAEAVANPSNFQIIKGRIYNVWRASLLSGLHSIQAKAVGDATMTALNFPVRAVASALGAFHEGGVSPAEPFAMLYGALHGGLDALKIGGRAFMNPDAFKAPLEKDTDTTVFDKVVNSPYRAFSAVTEFTRSLNQSMALWGAAVRQARDENYSLGSREWMDRVAAIGNGEVTIPAIEKEVASQGDRSAFVAKLGENSQDVLSKLNSHPIIGPMLMKVNMPFQLVPINLFKEGARLTPMPLLVPGETWADIKSGGAKADLAIGRMIVGTAAMTWAAHKFFSGQLTAPYNSYTSAELQRMIDEGKQPASFLGSDGKWHSYERWAPVNLPIGTATAMMKVMQDEEQGGGGSKADPYIAIPAAMANVYLNNSFMVGTNELLNAANTPAGMMRWTRNLEGSAIPAFISQPTIAADPYARRVNGYIDELKSRLPGLRETLPTKNNTITGQPLENPVGVGLFNTTTQSTDKVMMELNRLGVNAPRAPQAVHILKGSGKLGEAPLTPEQQSAFEKAAGQIIYPGLNSLVSSPYYDNMPAVIKREAFQKIIRDGRRYAAATALPPEMQQGMLLQIEQQYQDALQQK